MTISPNGDVRLRIASRRLRWLVYLSALAPFAASLAAAQQPPTTGAPSPTIARTYTLDIAAKPLPQAITDLSTQTGLQVLYTEALPFQRQAPAVRGNYTAEQALRLMLAGSGLTYRFTSSSAVTLQAVAVPGSGSASTTPPSGDMTVLPPLQVEGGAGESAYGPVRGFVARRSATGTKTDTPIVETPQSIVVVTSDQVEAQGAQTIPQALRYASGITAEPRGNMTKLEFIYSRGFQIDQYQDGLRLLGGPWGINQIDPYYLERIEVLKGPASILYGQASPGGLLNLVSKRPTIEPYYDFQAYAGSFDRFQGQFDLSGPITDDKTLLARLTVLERKSKTQADFSRDDRSFIAPSLTWRPTADTTLTILGSYQDDSGGGFYNFIPAYGSALFNPNGRISRSFNPGEPNFDRYDRRQYSIGYLFEHRFNEMWTVRQNFRFNDVETEFNNIFSNVLGANRRTLSRYTWHDKESLEAATLDNQVQAKFATAALQHTSIVGLDWQRREYEQLLGSNFGGPPAGAPPIDLFAPVYNLSIPLPAFTQDTIQTVDQLGFYFQDQIKYDRLVVLLGGRQDWTSFRSLNNLTKISISQSPDAFTGRAGLLYHFDFGLAPYFSYSESFQPTTGTDFGGAPFNPTTGEQYEVGVKYQPPGFNSLATLSAFELTQQNVLTTDPLHPGFSIQTGEVRARGVELSVVANLAEGWDLTGAYSYLHDKVTKSNSTNLGKWPAGIPRHKASLWSDYTISAGPFRGLGLGGGVRYVGATFGDSINSFKVADNTLFDAAITYDLGVVAPEFRRWQLRLTASNLFDKTYVSYCGTLNSCAYGTGRTILGGLRLRW